MRNFWQGLPKPFFALAPMADITDAAFREFIARTAPPAVLYTEFVSCRGLLSSEGRKHLLRDLRYTENQRPIVAQLFGGDPKDFSEAAKLIRDLGFDGLDINMGCPDKKIEKQGAGAALIRDPKTAKEIIRAAKKGAGGMPVSVKTRIGYNEIQTKEWIGALLEECPEAIIVHGRTRKEMSKVPAHWDEIARAAQLGNRVSKCGSKSIFVGNGDVASRDEGEVRASETGVDGIMIGRGVFGNPWVFLQTPDKQLPTANDKRKALSELIEIFSDIWKEEKPFHILRKHFSSYIRGFPGAREERMRLMGAATAVEALQILRR